MWRREQSVSISDADRQQILALGEDLPALWHAPTTTAADRKQIVRLVIKEIALDQKRRRGFVWIRVIWQTGATSEHWVQRQVQSYAAHADADQIRNRIIELNAAQKMDDEIATILNDEGLRTAHGPAFSGNMVYVLRKRWGITTSRSTAQQKTLSAGPTGSYSVQGAAEILGITSQTIFDWLRKGWLSGPWQIFLSPEQAAELRTRVRRTSRSKGEES